MYFIEPLHPAKYFSRGKFYGDGDDFRRFMYFSRAALELLLEAKKKPDIIHCHDWQTAFVVSSPTTDTKKLTSTFCFNKIGFLFAKTHPYLYLLAENTENFLLF